MLLLRQLLDLATYIAVIQVTEDIELVQANGSLERVYQSSLGYLGVGPHSDDHIGTSLVGKSGVLGKHEWELLRDQHTRLHRSRSLVNNQSSEHHRARWLITLALTEGDATRQGDTRLLCAGQARGSPSRLLRGGAVSANGSRALTASANSGSCLDRTGSRRCQSAGCRFNDRPLS